MEAYNVVFTEHARNLLLQHVSFLVGISPNAARKLYNAVYAKIEILYENPFQYPIWQVSFELPHEYRKLVVNKRYLIIYFIDGNNVFVDYVFDCSMDNSKFI